MKKLFVFITFCIVANKLFILASSLYNCIEFILTRFCGYPSFMKEIADTIPSVAEVEDERRERPGEVQQGCART
mgnify:CR=1 FL=1